MTSGVDTLWSGSPGGHNPVIEKMDLADPAVIRFEGRYYLYPTDEAGGALGFDVYLSDDLMHWTPGPHVFSHPGIGVAVADTPLGPFVDQGILIPDAIDAHLFRDDDGKLYLYYSYTPPLYVRRLTGQLRVQRMATPLQPDGDPIVLLRSGRWERFLGVVGIIEGPWMLKRNGTYYLMYSGNAASSVDYAIGYATADQPLGPFRKFSGNPVLTRGGGVLGPGHNSVVEAPDGSLVIVYHQKSTPAFRWWHFGDRVVCVDSLSFDDAGNIRIAATPLRVVE